MATAPATCALAPYITLTEGCADFEVRPLDFRKRQNFSPEYLKISVSILRSTETMERLEPALVFTT